MSRTRGLGRVEVIVIVAVVAVGFACVMICALGVGIMLPALGAARRTARQMQNGTQLRGIHQGMVLYSLGNDGWYPGVDGANSAVSGYQVTRFGLTASEAHDRMMILLDGNYFTPMYAVSPGENDPGISAWTGAGPFTRDHHSYAILDIFQGQGRQYEWRDNTNAMAVIASDRNVGPNPGPGVQSIWTNSGGDWRGSTVYGDNSARFLTTWIEPQTQYGNQRNGQDHLFQQTGDSDAVMDR